MSARDREKPLVMIAGVQAGKSLAIALAVHALREAGADVMMMDGPELIRPLEHKPTEPTLIRDRRSHTHPNSPMASYRSKRGRR